jgi:hypothetical protein
VKGEGSGGVRVGQSSVELLLRRFCALVVAGVAAYGSYRHQRAFALEGGADAVSAALWPLSVDGLLVLASAGLLKSRRDGGRRARVGAWSSFVLGVVVSLAANVASAPSLGWQPVLVAGWPPVALLLAVELLAHRSGVRYQFEPVGAGTESIVGSPASDPQHVVGPDLLAVATRVDEDHWSRWGRPASAETVRKELRIGAAKARALTRIVRDMSRPVLAEASTFNLDERQRPAEADEAMRTGEG